MRVVGALVGAVVLTGCVSPGTVADVLPGAEAYLWNEPYSSLVLDVDYVEGRAPTDATLEALERAARLTGKGELTIRVEEARPLGREPSREHAWSTEELRDFHRATFALADPLAVGEGARAYIHVMFLDGYADGIVGSANRNRLHVWPDSFDGGIWSREPIAPYTSPREIRERAVALHELGHLVGLVNSGIPMQTPHESPDSRGHSDDPASPMWPGIHGSGEMIPLFWRQDEIPDWYTPEDLADIAAFRARDPSRD